MFNMFIYSSYFLTPLTMLLEQELIKYEALKKKNQIIFQDGRTNAFSEIIEHLGEWGREEIGIAELIANLEKRKGNC